MKNNKNELKCCEARNKERELRLRKSIFEFLPQFQDNEIYSPLITIDITK